MDRFVVKTNFLQLLVASGVFPSFRGETTTIASVILSAGHKVPPSGGNKFEYVFMGKCFFCSRFTFPVFSSFACTRTGVARDTCARECSRVTPARRAPSPGGKHRATVTVGNGDL